MKFSFVFLLALLFIVSCGSDNDDNRNLLGVNALGQQCSLNTVNGYNNLNNFYNNNPYGQANPYQLELARRCGYALSSGFNQYGNNGYNQFGNNGGCYIPQDLQSASGVTTISRQSITDLNAEFETELSDVYGIDQPVVGQEEHYYNQVGFYAGVTTGGGYGVGNPYGTYSPQYDYRYCNQLPRF